MQAGMVSESFRGLSRCLAAMKSDYLTFLFYFSSNDYLSSGKRVFLMLINNGLIMYSLRILYL